MYFILKLSLLPAIFFLQEAVILKEKKMAGTLVLGLVFMLMPQKKNGKQIIACFHMLQRNCLKS